MVHFFGNLEPFVIIFVCFIGSSVLVILFDQYSLMKIKGPDLTNTIKKILINGKSTIFLSFIAVFDLLVFILIVPEQSMAQLEQDLNSSFLFYALLILLVPLILMKWKIDPKGKLIENLFWVEYREKIKQTKPSMDFALFILAKIQLKLTPVPRSNPRVTNQEEMNDSPIDDISTTTFPLDYSNNISQETLENKPKNTLFDSNEDLITENQLEKYYDEIYALIPGLEALVKEKPVNIRPELFLNIIIEQTLKDQHILQLFKEST